MILVKSQSLEHATASKPALIDQVSIIHCQSRMTFKEVLPAFILASFQIIHQRLGLTVSSALTALAVKLEDDPN